MKIIGLSGRVGNGDALAELLDALGAAADDLLLVALIKVVGAEVVIRGAVPDDVVADDQNGVGDGDCGPLPPTAMGDAAVLGTEIGLGASKRAGGLGQRCPQQLVPRSDASRRFVSAALVEPRAEL